VKLAKLTSPPAKESKRVHRSRFHLLQNLGWVNGQDKRQAAIDPSQVSPTASPTKQLRQTRFSLGFAVSDFGWASMPEARERGPPKAGNIEGGGYERFCEGEANG